MIVGYFGSSNTMLVVRIIKRTSVSEEEKKQWISFGLDNCKAGRIIQIMFT